MPGISRMAAVMTTPKKHVETLHLVIISETDGIPKLHTTNGLNLNTAGCSDQFEPG